MLPMKADQVSIAIRANLGRRIRSLREERQMSQYVFSEMVPINRSYLVSIEKGRRNVSIDNLSAIARGFGMPLSELFRDIDSFVYEQVELPEQ